MVADAIVIPQKSAIDFPCFATARVIETCSELDIIAVDAKLNGSDEVARNDVSEAVSVPTIGVSAAGLSKFP